MRITFILILTLLFTRVGAQSWSYVGGSCPNTEGSAKVKIKSNGNIVSAAFSFNSIYLKEWTGSNWQTIPSPNISGIVGGLQIELYQDTVFLAVINNGMKVFKWTGSSWISQGSINETFSDSNHDFLLDNNGVPYIGNAFTRKIFRFNGSTWQVVHTLPSGTFPNTYAYMFSTDNTLIFNNSNELVYSATVNNRQMVRKLSSTFVDELVGDTAIVLPPFTGYATIIKKNSEGELFALFTAFGKRSFVKKMTGNSWQLYGDSSSFSLSAGIMLMEMGQSGTILCAQSGSIDKKVWACTGQGNSFQQLDLISHTGFTQLTDLEVNPADGKVHVAFNCLPTHSVMRYDGTLTNTKDLRTSIPTVHAFPNPSVSGKFKITFPETETNPVLYVVRTLEGKTVLSGKVVTGANASLDLSNLPNGLYQFYGQTKDGMKVIQLSKP
ncbi:MAG TPA: hypothetical protein PK509_09930 [Catalimonadaceae bacterium]|mgnify:CR=1 FL=1|nr:hypothetical protein [Catalimonadaceae bacterium]HPI12663.1 hypothetical protein [Catalimonadaceae bacterium]